ncbi:hypothetical protein VUR80DRAFT_8823 [Thermomyces stellatus]
MASYYHSDLKARCFGRRQAPFTPVLRDRSIWLEGSRVIVVGLSGDYKDRDSSSIDSFSWVYLGSDTQLSPITEARSVVPQLISTTVFPVAAHPALRMRSPNRGAEERLLTHWRSHHASFVYPS